MREDDAGKGMTVTCEVSGEMCCMEDQRVYGDSSFKTYVPMPYHYPQVTQGDTHHQTLTLTVAHARAHQQQHGPATVTIKPGSGAFGVIPTLLTSGQSKPSGDFQSLRRETMAQAKTISWGYTPAVHLWDDAMLMENLAVIREQVRTVRAVAPTATLRLDPINFNSPHPRPAPDLRNRTPFGAAWVLAAVNMMAQSGINEAVFTVEPGPGRQLLSLLAPYAGHPLLATSITANQPTPITAWAIHDGKDTVLWLANLTDQRQLVRVRCPGLASNGQVTRFNDNFTPLYERTWATKTRITLSAYEVCRITMQDGSR